MQVTRVWKSRFRQASEYIRWLCSPSAVWASFMRCWLHRRTRKLAAKSLRMMVPASKQVGRDAWLVYGSVVRDRQVMLLMTSHPEHLEIVAGARLMIKPETVPGWVLWDALHMNSTMGRSRFCIQNTQDGFQLVAKASLETRQAIPREVATVGLQAMAGIEFLIRHLYAQLPRLIAEAQG